MLYHKLYCVFQKAFDHSKARSEGTIRPRAGMDPEYDQAVNDIQRAKQALDDYLDRQKKRLGCKVGAHWLVYLDWDYDISIRRF